MKALKVSFCVLIIVFIFSQTLHAQTAPAPGGWVAQLVSVEGSAQLKKAGDTKWSPARLNERLFAGDMLRVMDNSRAAVVMRNQSNVRLDENTTITFKGIEEGKTVFVEILEGMSHFFNRVTRSLKVFTPYVNGMVQGTEFLVKVDKDQTLITIFDGRVSAENEKGSVIVTGGQSVVAKAGQAPILTAVVRPRDAVQWALFYPTIIDFRPEDFAGGAPWQEAARKSVELYNKRDIAGAFESLKGLRDEDLTDTRYLNYRAMLALRVGRVDDASVYLDRVLKADPNNAGAQALQSIIAVVQNRKDEALGLAKKAIALDPQSSASWTALSYAQQARFDLQGAKDSARQAVSVNPNDAFAHARLAELWLSEGYLNMALEEAQRAVSINPNLARTQTVLGYAYLTQIRIAEARVAFEKATALNPGDPQPRLGLGLAKIRKGDLEGGRQDIEIAASLDVNNSLVRSYLGKAYYEEKREKLSGDQFKIAKQLDPMDPTAYFYDAILKQSTNRPVEALQDIQKSIELNNNRAVYRSGLLMDQDLAARSASQAQIFNNLGFQQPALVEGRKSVSIDPTNFSAHRFLADAYLNQPRAGTARVSELLQSQLMQPLNINPTQASLANSNLQILQGTGPSSLAYNEFNTLFNRNRVALQASGVAGNKDTYGDEITASALYDRYSLSLSQFYYRTDGFRENADQKRSIYDAFGQVMITPSTSVLAEARYTDERMGDPRLRFDPANYNPFLKQTYFGPLYRLGVHHNFAPGSDVIGHVSFQKADLGWVEPGYDGDFKGDKWAGELQYIHTTGIFKAIIGGGFSDLNWDYIETYNLADPPERYTSDQDEHIWKGYIYTLTNFPSSVIWTLGVSYDWYRNTPDGTERDQVNPKLGVSWTPSASTTLRAAAYRTLWTPIVGNQTIEPTQVAGFNQLIDDLTGTSGTEVWNYGVGADQKILPNLFGGVEGIKRDTKIPWTSFSTGEVIKNKWTEWLGRAYLNWAPHPWVSLTAEYQYEKFDRDLSLLVSVDGFSNATVQRIPLGVNFFHPSGIIAGAKGTYVHEDVDPVNVFFDPETGLLITSSSTSESFWIFDALLGYRLPKRYGIVSLEARNLFNNGIRFLDTDPGNPVFNPCRIIIGRITLNF